MPELPPEVRSKTMDEVATGYSAEEAKKEALRCLNCKKPGCIDGCPVRIDIPKFISHIAEGDFQSAIDKKKDGFDAAFIGTGAGLPLFMGIPGEELNGVFSANEFLTRANLMRAYERDFADTPLWEGKEVAVLGGGNVAMDAARVSVRLGAKVRIIYRRTAAEMPARAEEIHHAMEEGVEFCYLQNPSEILGDEKGFVRALKIERYKLGEPDDKGRPRPVKLEGESFELPVDTVLVAIGNSSNPLISQGMPELKVNKRGNIELLNPEINATYVDGIFAGGDIVLGAATVILAMGEGRRAAKGILLYLNKQPS
ncbi:glutamate synthase, small subunit [Fibrobacteria bacterium R8-3-H12]